MAEEAPPAPFETELESSPEHLYFLAIEKAFIAERGSPLYLSPKDWLVAERWHEMGIPLEWVERTLRDIFETRRAKGTAKKIVSLGYCRRSVEAAWKKQQKMRAPEVATVPEIDVAARLAALAAALPPAMPDREAWGRRLGELEGGAEAVEERLKDVDRQVMEAAAAGLDKSERRRIEEDLARAVANLARRLPARELRGVEKQLREQLLRDYLGLPVLSLFAPEASPD